MKNISLCQNYKTEFKTEFLRQYFWIISWKAVKGFLSVLFLTTRRNDQLFRREIATTLFRHETIFNFHMNNFDTIIENMIKNKVITFKNVKSNWE